MEIASTSAVLLLGLPQSALAGIDLLAFTTTPRFQGIKNIPTGLHFLFTGSSTAFSVRHGRWFNIGSIPEAHSSSPPLIIAKWDAASETLLSVTDEAEQLRWRANLGRIWRESLAPYRQSSSKDAATETQEERNDWPQLTAYISEALLSRISGSGDNGNFTLTSASSAKWDLDDIPGLNPEESNLHPENDLHLLPIDLKQTWREGATGRERTDAAQDRSWALGELVEKHCAGAVMEIVGELQFCFLMVLTLNNWSCFQQWKRILTLLFTCRAAVLASADLFIRAIATLRLQLQHCKDAEGELIDLADEGGSLLKELLVRFRKGLEGFSVIDTQDVIDELGDLEAYLSDEHGWQFGGSFAKSGLLELEDGEQVRVETVAYDEDDEAGEYAPQVVNLTPEQARMLNFTDAEDLHVSLSKTSLHEVVTESQDDESDAQEPEREEARSEDEESEEAEDLDDMDARY